MTPCSWSRGSRTRTRSSRSSGRSASLRILQRQALERATQTVEAHLHGAEADPIATADDATLPRRDPGVAGDGDAGGATEIDVVRSVVERDQHGERIPRVALSSRGGGDGLGGWPRERRDGRAAIEADGGRELAWIARDEAT